MVLVDIFHPDRARPLPTDVHSYIYQVSAGSVHPAASTCHHPVRPQFYGPLSSIEVFHNRPSVIEPVIILNPLELSGEIRKEPEYFSRNGYLKPILETVDG